DGDSLGWEGDRFLGGGGEGSKQQTEHGREQQRRPCIDKLRHGTPDAMRSSSTAIGDRDVCYCALHPCGRGPFKIFNAVLIHRAACRSMKFPATNMLKPSMPRLALKMRVCSSRSNSSQTPANSAS